MTIAHLLGFPRIGARRELKRALEAYWNGAITQPELLRVGAELRARHWGLQKEAGMDFVAVGDFSWYDHVLDMSALLGVVPPRFDWTGDEVDLDTYFRMARGTAPTGKATHACEMTKWFDTNYHYIVPEFQPHQRFGIASGKLFEEVKEAQAAGLRPKAVLVGPVTYLWLGKAKGGDFERLDLLERLLPVYEEILQRLAAAGVEWVQVDEPALVVDLPRSWLEAYERAYRRLAAAPVKLLLASYFGGLHENADLACRLPVAGLHVDLVRGPAQLPDIAAKLPAGAILSAGVIDGRNVWRADLDQLLAVLEPATAKLGERLWVSASCSLLHTPVDLSLEAKLDAELKSWLAFAVQKLEELAVLKRALEHGRQAVAPELARAAAIQASRRASSRIHDAKVKQRVAGLSDKDAKRGSPFAQRRAAQRRLLNLPPYPTTTIGSFPQTQAIRTARADYRAGRITEAQYTRQMRAAIKLAVRKQEQLGLDVLVHGEAERNDMVEYFGEQLRGFAFTANGWVQSYGSRCVKPPIIYGDVSRPKPMTVEWSTYAQSLTDKPMKGMLTGPVTILQWSFVRDDQPRAHTALQIACAIRDEACDLERAGIKVIQIDEPAVREGLPLRRAEHREYLQWAVRAFKVAAGGVHDTTQIHTHMCYAEFNDIMDAVADMDADVITIETSRSDMELLDAFVDFKYPNEIGPGVYDIHSPRVPDTADMVRLMRKARALLPPENLWVNPDCGLKTRGWPEVEQALAHMVQAARILRAEGVPAAGPV